jgi:hypothetical protein
MKLKAILLSGLVLAATLSAQSPDAYGLMREALQTAQSGDLTSALTKMESAVALRPTHPSYLYNQACLQSLAGRSAAALATLQRLADFGVYTPAATDADFTRIAEMDAFKAITAKFQANLEPRGDVKESATLPAQLGLIEGIAVRSSTGEVFFGDMHLRCVWRHQGEAVTRFTAADDRLFGIGGLVVDEARGILWAACSAQQVMTDWSEENANRSALAGFDLNTGELMHYHRVPDDGRPHATVDLTLAANGTVYLSDSASPIIWRLQPGAEQLEAWVDDPRFRSLQGLALSNDERELYVADYAWGLFSIDTATGEVTALPTPQGYTLVGIDGLGRSGNRLIAVQNGLRPARVLAIDLQTDGSLGAIHELAAAWPEMKDITLGSISRGKFHFVADAGWRFFEPGQSPPPHGRRISILAVELSQ